MTPSATSDPTLRFSDRVDFYVNYRPRYPAAILTFLRNLGLLPTHVVADVGSGTGFLSELFLSNDNTVYAVEPNDAMRRAAEEIYGEDPKFISVNGTAEHSGLEDRSVDLVVAGQAFHWFRPEETREEFLRILRPGGLIALIWNERRIEAGTFSGAYEDLLRRFGTDYQKVNHQRLDADDAAEIRAFFAPHDVAVATFDNGQTLDLGGLRGRLLSSSYAPMAGEESHEAMMKHLEQIFDEHQQSGVVRFDYTTTVYYGSLD